MPTLFRKLANRFCTTIHSTAQGINVKISSFLIGNHISSLEINQVSKMGEYIRELVNKENVTYIETSTITRNNIEEMFIQLTNKILKERALSRS
jgi:hypothetical protein